MVYLYLCHPIEHGNHTLLGLPPHSVAEVHLSTPLFAHELAHGVPEFSVEEVEVFLRPECVHLPGKEGGGRMGKERWHSL